MPAQIKTNTVTAQNKILVVDTDSTICEMLRAHFGPEGFVVDQISTADEIFSIELSAYSLMIIDTNIDGGMGAGMGIVEHVKQRRDTAGLGVITCSTNMSPQTIINALNAGADDYLLKPFSLRELMTRVRSVLNRQLN